ncbi:MAG TPA: autotransporter domain-containing protein [Gallionella sp.]|nr:autotransporter domain-containing protein [Gallionella sp.]
MNHVHRVVWSEARQAFVVTNEKARARGKPSSTRNAIVSAVAAALIGLNSPSVLAVANCPQTGGSPISITTAQNETCFLASGDWLTVTGTGSISGVSPAVDANGVGFSSVDNSGLLSGTVIGIDIYNGASTVNTINNNAGGTISGSNFGIHIADSNVGRIVNNGTITGNGAISLFDSSVNSGISTLPSGIVNSGAISGSSYGIGLNNSSVTGGITNNGTISGFRGIYLFNSNADSISNNTGGMISGAWDGIGLYASQLAGDVLNDVGSTISASGMGIYLASASNAGSIVNHGTIAGSSAGISLSDGSGTGSINNSGTISGGIAGIWVGGVGSSSSGVLPGQVTGDITNTGTISGSSAGVALTGGSTVGSITNSGTISGNGAAVFIGGASVNGDITNETTGIISTTTESGIGAGIYVSQGKIGGSIVNQGTITGGIALVNSSTVTGDITNNAGGLITRSGSSAFALYLGSGSSAGSITNHGTISGANVGVWIAGASSSGREPLPAKVTGNITNTGTIAGGSVGVVLTGGSTVGGIANSGTISGNIAAILIDGTNVTGDITNDTGGMITGPSGTGTGAGIYLSGGSTLNGSIVNSGTVTGGIALTSSAVGGSITNNAGGFISGNLDGIALSSSSMLAGGIINHGTITGGATGITVDDTSVVSSIDNAGTINGGTGPAICILGAVTDGITNTGTINGDIALNGATLNLNGTAGSVNGAVTGGTGSTVNVNGTFATANTFAVDNFNIANGGQLNLGHDITTTTGFNNAGTLSVTETGNVILAGNYTQDANGILRLGAASNTVYGRVNVTGTATLPAAAKIDVNVSSVNTLAPGDTLAGALTAGTLSATTFAVTDNSALFDFTGSVNGNAVDLKVNSVVSVLDSVNAGNNLPAIGAATTLDALIAAAPGGDMGNVITALGKLPTQADVSSAVTQTLPLLAGSMTQFAFNRLHGINRIIEARQEQNRGLSSGDGFVSNRHGWVKPIGSSADQKDRNAAFGYRARTYGLVAGADKELSQTARLGAAFAYTRSAVDSNSAVQAANVDSYLAAVYGSHRLSENTELNWQADYGHNRNRGHRYIALLGRLALVDYTSSSAHFGAGLGRTMAMSPKTTFVPSVRADYTSIRDNGYTETGAGALNLVVGSKTTDEFILSVDGKLVHALSDSTRLTANLGVGYDTRAKQASITSSFAGGGAAFTTAGIHPASTLVRGGLGVVTNTRNATEVTTRYDVEARDGFIAQTASIKFRMPL